MQKCINSQEEYFEGTIRNVIENVVIYFSDNSPVFFFCHTSYNKIIFELHVNWFLETLYEHNVNSKAPFIVHFQQTQRNH